MRKLWCNAVLWGVLGLVVFPGLAFAQGLGRPLGPWDFLANLGASAYTGYFGHRDGVNLTFSASDQPTNSVGRLRQQYRLEGISTQLVLPVRGAGPLGFLIGGGYSACFPTEAEETLDLVGAGSLQRTWKVSPQGGNIQAAVTLDIFPSVLGLLAFRYENFQTRFSDPRSAVPAELSAGDSANIAYNAYLPCIGLVTCMPGPISGLNVQLGFIGCPVLLGSVDYRESWLQTLAIGGGEAIGFTGSNPIGKGAYFDAFAEVSLFTQCGVQLGAYGRYEYMTASTGVYVSQGNPIIPTVFYDFDFQRRLWGVGGKVSVTF
jgi:hypothetical protein